MKKILAPALALLMLWGCGTETPEPTTVPTEPVIEETVPATEEIVISYDSLEFLEFDYEAVYAAAPMGDDLLLFSNMDSTTLIKVSGRNHKELASIDTGAPISPDFRAVQINENGVCYAAEGEYIFLNENLEEVERVSLYGAWGTGVVAADQNTIYYSTGSQLRVFNRETGLDRLLRETTHTGLVLESLELNDSILVCQLFDHHAVPATLFYSAATGELLDTYEDSISLSSAGDMWLAKTSDGHRSQMVFCGAEPQVLTAGDSFSDVTLISGGLLIRTRTETTAAIRFLDPASGTEAAVAIGENEFITNAWLADGILWIALDDGRLCRWELDNTETQAISCFAPYYSRENPDTAGLAALEPVIEDLETAYGVEIHILEEAVAAHPEGMTLRSEYQVDDLTAGLEQLEQALSRFTPEFLAVAGKSSEDGKLHISLVRSVSSEGCIQFWDDNGIARIVLTADEYLQRSFFHGLGHIIDSRVLSKSGAFDTWKNLNPKGFSYTGDYAAELTSGEFSEAFADPRGMISPLEDRAWIFTEAMLADNGSLFEAEITQRKLDTLCSGIRKAFGLKNSDEILPWEQYLTE